MQISPAITDIILFGRQIIEQIAIIANI